MAAGTRLPGTGGGGGRLASARCRARLAVPPGRGAPDRPRLTQGSAEPGEWGQGAAPPGVTAPSRASAPPPFHSVAQHGWSTALSPRHRHCRRRRRHRRHHRRRPPGALGTGLSSGRPQACWAPRTRARCAWLSGELRVGRKAGASERAGWSRCVASRLLREQQWPPPTRTPLRIWRHSLHGRHTFGLRVSAARCPRETPLRLRLPPCRWARGVCPPPPSLLPGPAPRRAGSEPRRQSVAVTSARPAPTRVPASPRVATPGLAGVLAGSVLRDIGTRGRSGEAKQRQPAGGLDGRLGETT